MVIEPVSSIHLTDQLSTRGNIMDDTIQFIETPESTVLRINSDAMSHLGTTLSESLQYEDENIKKTLLSLLQKHSEAILETSNKIVMKQRLNIQAVS